MKTIIFRYDTDTEDLAEAVEEAREMISCEDFEPFAIEDHPDEIWNEGNVY